MTATIVLTAILAGVAGFALLWFLNVAYTWKGGLAALQEQYQDLLRTSAEIQKQNTLIETERDHIKQFMNTFLTKQVQAVLSDQQFHQLIQLLDARIKFEQEGSDEPKPKKMVN